MKQVFFMREMHYLAQKNTKLKILECFNSTQAIDFHCFTKKKKKMVAVASHLSRLHQHCTCIISITDAKYLECSIAALSFGGYGIAMPDHSCEQYVGKRT